MFNFLNLGFDGYRKIAFKDLRNARMLSRALEDTYFEVFSNIHRPVSVGDEHKRSHSDDDPQHYEPGLPVVAFRFSEQYRKENPTVQQAWVQTMLKTKGWIVPNYNAPKGSEDVEILRVVVRETLSEDLLERLIIDLLDTAATLASHQHPLAVIAVPAVISHPDHGHARPEKENFSDGGNGEGPQQSGFSRQC